MIFYIILLYINSIYIIFDIILKVKSYKAMKTLKQNDLWSDFWGDLDEKKDII